MADNLRGSERTGTLVRNAAFPGLADATGFQGKDAILSGRPLDLPAAAAFDRGDEEAPLSLSFLRPNLATILRTRLI
jgi:hypothetical protein